MNFSLFGKNNFDSYKITTHINDNINSLKSIFDKDGTLVVRKFRNIKNNFVLIFFEGMSDNKMICEGIGRAILTYEGEINLKDFSERLLYINDVKEIKSFDKVVSALLMGDSVLFAEGLKIALQINTKGYEKRSVEEPSSEKVTRGPREGFLESVMLNTGLIRKRLQTADLTFEFTSAGTRTNSKVCIAYIKGLVSEKKVLEIKDKVNDIIIDGIIDTNIISEKIREGKYSPFKTVGTTERPDVAVARLLEGKIVIISDGTPVVLTLPCLFLENFQRNEDYYLNFYLASIIRFMRFISFFLAISVPAIYISFVNFHWNLIPPNLALNIQRSHQEIPITTFVECLFMIGIFEVIKESGQRLSSGAGQAVSIVGALVVGQAAIEANVVSAPMVIVVALSAITGLVNPKVNSAVIFLRICFIAASTFLGFFGFFILWTFVIIHLLKLESFGVSYTEGIFSSVKSSNMDAYVRYPWNKLYKRPAYLWWNKKRALNEKD